MDQEAYDQYAEANPYPDDFVAEPEPYRPRRRPRERHPAEDRYEDFDRYAAEEDDRYAPERSARRARREPRGLGIRGPSADAIGRTIQIVTSLISLAFVLHVIFVLSGANQENGFVSFTYSVVKIFVFGLGDVFQPGDATIGVVLNYGLAALVYLFGGRIIARALRS